MATLDDEIIIEVVRKEEVTKVPVHFGVKDHTTTSMTYLQYVRLFNWEDAKSGDCEELISFLDYAFGITFNQPRCYTYDYPGTAAGDSEVEIEDNDHLVLLSLQGDLERIVLAIDDDPYRFLYTGKVCGYNDLDVYAEMNEKTVTLPSEVMLLSNQKPKFKVHLTVLKAIEFELGVSNDETINCERVWGIEGWCNRTAAPRVVIEDNLVNISIDPIYITSEEVLTILQERGKIDTGKLPPALQTGTSGWTWQGDEVAPSSGLSTNTKLAYSALWLDFDRIGKTHLLFTIDLAYGNPPTRTAAIDMSCACDGKLPCAPAIHASLDELPIVEEEEAITIPITFVVFDLTDNLSEEIREAISFINENTPKPVSFVSETIRFDDATELTCEGTDKQCCMLEPEDVRDMGYEDKLPKHCIGYYLLWKQLDESKNCLGGICFWPPQGLNGRGTATSAYNVWYWKDLSDWHPTLTTGEAIIIHEIHHMLALTLDDKGHYNQSFYKEDQSYGITIPFIDSMTAFGFSNEYEWTQWCYQQLTYDMCKQLSEIAATDSDIPPEPLEPPTLCSFFFPTPGYDLIIRGTEYKTPIEITIPVTHMEAEQGLIYEATTDILFKSPIGECYTPLCAFIIPPGEWALDETAASDCLFDVLEKATGTQSKLVIRLKEIEELEAEAIDGTISILESTIPTTLYQQTPSAFDMAIINTGTLPTEYQIAITFEGVDVTNEEVFWSNWSGDVAPNESTTLPVLVELSERAIPEGAETAEYNILTKLVAR